MMILQMWSLITWWVSIFEFSFNLSLDASWWERDLNSYNISFLSSLSLIYNDVHVNTANTIHLLHRLILGICGTRISSGFASTTVSYQLYLTFCMFSYLSWVSYYLSYILWCWNWYFLFIRSTLSSPNARLDDGLGSLSKRPYLVPPCNYIGHFLKIKQISEVDYWIFKRHLNYCRSGTLSWLPDFSTIIPLRYLISFHLVCFQLNRVYKNNSILHSFATISLWGIISFWLSIAGCILY